MVLLLGVSLETESVAQVRLEGTSCFCWSWGVFWVFVALLVYKLSANYIWLRRKKAKYGD